jgi:hypothetical protein
VAPLTLTELADTHRTARRRSIELIDSDSASLFLFSLLCPIVRAAPSDDEAEADEADEDGADEDGADEDGADEEDGL